MAKRERANPSLILIADVLKAGQKMTTGAHGVRSYLLPGIEVTLSSLPAGIQGGDFYGMVYLKEECAAVFIGDISGHDFSSSIVATEVVDYIDKHQESLWQPHLFLRRMARQLYKRLSSVSRFFTTALCIADIENNRISYASAGHPPALLFNAREQTISEVGLQSLPPGFEEDISYDLLEMELVPGDILVMYTDGLSSARSSGREEFGMDRIMHLLRRWTHDPRSIVPQLMNAVKAFSENADNVDDVTVICMTRT